MDRAALRRRKRRRRGQLRLAVAVAILLVVIVLVVQAVRGCGEDEQGQAAAPRETAASPLPAATDTRSPQPVSSEPPLVGMGDTVRFQTPEGAVVRVRVGNYKDPGDAPAGATAAAGERLVTLELRVTPEGAAGTAAVPLPFSKADSFMLVAENDTLTVAQLGNKGLLNATVPPGESIKTRLAFSVGAAAPIRFVCRPEEGSTPVSATWELSD